MILNFRESLDRAEVLMKHKEQLHDIWGVGGGRKPVRFLCKEMITILKEFLASGDEKEASRCLRELEVPHFNHEFVYQAGVMAVEGMHERSVRLLATLLLHLTQSGELTQTAIEKGFDRFYANLSDLSIDVPPAYALAEWWTKASRDSGFLPKHIADRLPRK
uniref:Programmed cell death protein 4 n=1 Tax=Plectus sambesii TaxID=2011161 RepID=A0A914UM00_9BILA